MARPIRLPNTTTIYMARERNPPTTPSDRLFLDTGYVIARFNGRDQYHSKTKQLAQVVATARNFGQRMPFYWKLPQPFPIQPIAPSRWRFGMNSTAETHDAA